MKKILCALALSIVAACGVLGTSTGYNRDNIRDAVEIVVERHDSYVKADEKLTLEQRVAFEHESFQVLSCLQYDPVPATMLQAALPPVLDRTEAYVNADTALSAPEQVRQLRTVILLRDLIQPKN